MTVTEQADYLAELDRWRQEKETVLSAPDGWLSLVGLHWLNDGVNTIGADEDSDVSLPVNSIPHHLGIIELAGNHITLRTEADVTVTVDGVETREASLRDDSSTGGKPSQVQIGSVTFFIIERGGNYAVRVRDSENPARLTFEGRRWFPVDQRTNVTGVYVPHETPRTLQIVTSAGNAQPMVNPGKVEFTLNGQSFALEAFEAAGNQVWFVFKDATSGRSTYGAGRFLYAPLTADGAVHLDFNKAYHPPCAFTPFAACPLPPKGNVLPVEILAGERL